MLRPTHDHVVVQTSKEEMVTKMGIVLPDTVKEKPEQGKVVAVGPGKILANGNLAAMSVKVGDIVLFKKYSPDEVKVNGEEYLIIRDEDILAVVA
ncbi:co-chaperone GroES [Candidatus Uhrbacteria bacterium]|nr:co-chaperone GroES [Candidatus Uhrbacteria bacterium]